jgi:hypothetical protein
MKQKFFDKQKSEFLLCRFIFACHKNRASKRGDLHGRHAFLHKTRLNPLACKNSISPSGKENRKTVKKALASA